MLTLICEGIWSDSIVGKRTFNISNIVGITELLEPALCFTSIEFSWQIFK